jgi:addiction module HigA family antidote
LKGDGAGEHSIRINGQWRIVFAWRNDGAYGVEIVDYHSAAAEAFDLAITQELISREDLDAGRVSFGELDDGERPSPVHPGDVLRVDFLEAMGMTAHALALVLRVPANRVTAILAGKRAVTADTALRLARHFGTSAGFWLNLQKSYELEVTERVAGARIRAEVLPRHAA